MAESCFDEDLKYIASVPFIDWESLRGKSIFITGSTGLIGKMLTKALLLADKEYALGLKLLILVRDPDKARDIFGREASLTLIEGSIENIPEIPGNVDYIIHAAGRTASRDFIEKPAEVIDENIRGIVNILELGRKKQVSSLVYLSTMEVYGYPEKGLKVMESYTGAVDSLNIRSSYPLSKKMCENICVSYAGEYGVPARIIRLTQTFGAGVLPGDKRIFGYLADCAYKGEEIVLKTKGETERCYLYTADAVTAILAVLLSGRDGEAYNAADEGTYCSIAGMAGIVSEKWGTGLRYEIADAGKNGFLDTLYMDLDTKKLKALNWSVKDGGRSIGQMFERMIRDF